MWYSQNIPCYSICIIVCLFVCLFVTTSDKIKVFGDNKILRNPLFLISHNFLYLIKISWQQWRIVDADNMPFRSVWFEPRGKGCFYTQNSLINISYWGYVSVWTFALLASSKSIDLEQSCQCIQSCHRGKPGPVAQCESFFIGQNRQYYIMQ